MHATQTALLAAALAMFATLGACSRGSGALFPPASLYAQRVAFLADKDVNDVVQLYAAQFDSAVRNLTPHLTVGGNVAAFAWSPDRRLVAFRADQFSGGLFEIFVADAATGEVRKVNTPLQPFSIASLFAWAPDGARLAWVGGGDTAGADELYTVAPDGSGTVRLNPPFINTQDVSALAWSPNAARVAYVANQEDPAVQDLFVAPADASAPAVRVSGPMVAGGNIAGGSAAFAWSPDSTRLAYRADQETDGAVDLFVARADGSVNGRVSVAGALGVPRFAWASNGVRIAYLAVRDSPLRQELRTVLSYAADDVLVSGPLVTDGNVLDFAWSPDGTLLCYRADQEIDGQDALYVVPAAGGTVVRVCGALQGAGVTAFAWAPDGSRIAYVATQDSSLVRELYSVLPDGSSDLRISQPFTVFGNVEDLRWSPDARRLAYRADADQQGVPELHVTGALGGSARVSGPSSTGQGVVLYDWAADAAHLVFTGAESTAGKVELYLTSIAGGAQRISGAIVAGGNVQQFALPDRPGP